MQISIFNFGHKPDDMLANTWHHRVNGPDRAPARLSSRFQSILNLSTSYPNSDLAPTNVKCSELSFINRQARFQ